MAEVPRIGIFRPLIWLVLPLVAVLVIVVDPLIGDRLPPGIQRPFGQESIPIPLLPTLLVLLGLIAAAIRVFGRGTEFTIGAMFALFAASQLNGFGIGPLDVFDFALFVVFLGWAATLALDPARPLRIGFLVSIAFFIGVLAVAHLPVMRPVSWVIGMIGVARIFLIALLVVDLCRDTATLERVIRLFVIIAVISAVIGIIQFFLAFSGLWVFTLIDPPESAFKPTPVGFVMRASGLCVTAQHYSSFLSYALPYAFWQLSVRPTPGSVFAVVMLVAGILVSWNTGAILATALVALLFPFLRWPERSAGLAVLLVAAVSIAYFSGLLQLIYDLTFGDAGVAKGVDQRKTLFTLGIEQIAANPFVGSGLRGFGDVDGNFWRRPVHNVFGQATAELGVLGLVAVLALFIVPLVDLSNRLFSNDTHELRRAAFLALLTALLLAQSEPNLEQSNLWLLFALIQATILATRAPAHSTASRALPPQRGATRPPEI